MKAMKADIGPPSFLLVSDYYPCSLANSMKLAWSGGTASVAKMAATGHTGSQAAQSIHSSGLM
tara:strand:- start:3159 stop:3347 length:189 start_codon:yes stop_codon:yes gene_type:complete